jgi:tripartite-type tricarboxylate transporter receptor subunit TctC
MVQPFWRGPAIGVLLGAGLLVSSEAFAQSYPSRPLRMLVPFAPGGNVDITARAISGEMSTALGRPVIVENRPGASGMIAADLVAKSLPDGYTLLIASTGVMTNLPALRRDMPYDVVRDFAAVSRVAIVPLVLIVHPSVPVRTTREFIALARSKPGRLLIASSGAGTNLFAEQLMISTGSRLTTVAYKGSGPALVDLVAGHVDCYLDQLTSSLGYVRSGRARAIAVSTAARAALLREVPTLSESGVPGFNASTVTGIFVPAATPQAIVERLNDVLTKLLKAPAIRERFATVGAEAAPATSSDFAAFIRNDIARWKSVAGRAGIRSR